ncbi:MAG: hypothetical protein PHH84_03170 [Oscillospiraceae bacterium]|nr:hypothetical protein [Oscillospiraceae bacterium]MDD4413210.1 hypothetical protein [Oscillospiraceae bacterium]
MHIKKNILRIAAVLSCILLFGSVVCASAESLYQLPSNTKLSAKSAIVVSLGATDKEDAVLFELKADSKRSPAALVRLMVGVTAIEMIREKGLDIDKMTGKYTSAQFNLISGSQLATVQMSYINQEEWTIRDLLSISMIQTAADACVTLATTLAGSNEKFVARMNSLAAEIGCTNTSFSNVTGLDAPNQYTTASDLYKIIRYGMKYPEFEPLFSAVQHTVNPVKGGSTRTYANTNDMMRQSTPYYYSPVAFGKTGFTDSAGRCLASVARDSGYEYLCVVLGVPDTDSQGQRGAYFKDTKALFYWAFNNFTYETLLNKNEPITTVKVNLAWNKDKVSLVPKESFSTIVIKGLDLSTVVKKPIGVPESIDAPVKKGQVFGKVQLIIQTDRVIGEVDLVADESIERSEVLDVWAKILSFLSSPWFYVSLGLLLLLLIGYIILNIVHNRNRRRNRMKRINKYR